MGSWGRKTSFYVWCVTCLSALTVTETTLAGFTWPRASSSAPSSTLLSTLLSNTVASTSLLSFSTNPSILSPTLSLKYFPDVPTLPSIVSPAAMQTHIIKVGEEDHKFTPDLLYAAVGDVIRFQFYPLNHSVVRAEYKHSCEPYEKHAEGGKGFFSGFHPIKAGDEASVWDLMIDKSDPMFFYCSAPNSCDQLQMVGVINPTDNASLAVQKEYSINAIVQQPYTTSNVAKPSTPYSHAPLSNGSIVGISLAGLLILTLAAALFFFIGRSRSLKQEVKRRNSTISPLPASSMYQQHSFLSPHSEAMANLSSRNSAAGYGPHDYGRNAAPYYSYQSGNHLRSETVGPGVDWAYARNINSAPETPIRHALVLSCVQDLQEMDASDGKQAGE